MKSGRGHIIIGIEHKYLFNIFTDISKSYAESAFNDESDYIFMIRVGKAQIFEWL